MKKGLAIIWFVLLLVSCEEVTDWDQQGTFTPRLVVDGMVTNQQGYSYVKLSLPVTASGEIPRTVSNAEVFISTGDSLVPFTEDMTEPGTYRPDPSMRAVIGRIYHLEISFENFSFTASAGMIPVAPFSPFLYNADDDKAGYYRINPTDTNNPTMLRYTVEWVDDQSGQEVKSIFYHYTLSTIDVNQFFKPGQQSLSFPGNARIIREQYSLSPDHEQYIRSLLSETEWKGGWFDVLPGNLHTNLSRGGTGYFAASSMLVDTVYFEEIK